MRVQRPQVRFRQAVHQVDADIAASDATSALAALADLRTHVDGCGTAPDSTDWIVDCTAQVQVRGLIDQGVTKLGGP